MRRARAGVKGNTRKKTTRSADRHQDETDFRTYGNGRNQEREPGMSVRGIKCIQGF